MVAMATDRVSLLLVEDDADVREILSDLLANHGYSVHVAETGQQALDLADSEWPDCVLLDIGLPDLDGTLVARELRRRFGSDLMIVALTGYSPERIEASGDSGIDHILTKPVSLDALSRLLPPL
jgi:DNA-binding response OmpR family regulator